MNPFEMFHKGKLDDPNDYVGWRGKGYLYGFKYIYIIRKKDKLINRYTWGRSDSELAISYPAFDLSYHYRFNRPRYTCIPDFDEVE